MTLERLEGEPFTEVTRPGGLPYGDDGFETIVRYIGRCDRVTCLEHRWRLRWQERRDFPVGRYRIRIEGKARKGGEVVPYVARSRVFEVVPSTALWIQSLAARGGRLEGNVVDRPAVRLEPDGDGQRAEPSAFLLRDPAVPGELGATIAAGTRLAVTGSVRSPEGEVVPLSGSVEVEVVTGPRLRLRGYEADGRPRTENHRKEHPTSRFGFATDALDRGPGDYRVTLTLTDPLGNAGTVTATITR
jgi:hypothetical protein